ncbi:hypothetical protein H0H93_000783 [Arthromyces matolae]|nr:hypothetical protein H0H93_000783 [Arthromyces matolae]
MKFLALFQIVAMSLLYVNTGVNAVPVPATANSNVLSTGSSLSSGPGSVALSTRYLLFDPNIGLEVRNDGPNEASSSGKQIEVPSIGYILHPQNPNQAHTSPASQVSLEELEKDMKKMIDETEAAARAKAAQRHQEYPNEASSSRKQIEVPSIGYILHPQNPNQAHTSPASQVSLEELEKDMKKMIDETEAAARAKAAQRHQEYLHTTQSALEAIQACNQLQQIFGSTRFVEVFQKSLFKTMQGIWNVCLSSKRRGRLEPEEKDDIDRLMGVITTLKGFKPDDDDRSG